MINILSRLLKKAGSLGLIEDIGSNYAFMGIKGLQYADGTLLYCASEKKKSLMAMKAIMLALEVASGSRINFHKSFLVYVNMLDEMPRYLQI